jgi:hypothetical protein
VQPSQHKMNDKHAPQQSTRTPNDKSNNRSAAQLKYYYGGVALPRGRASLLYALKVPPNLR